MMVLLQGDKMIALLWWSMTVRMLSYPFNVRRSVMKSIVIISHGPSGILVGFSGTLTGGHIFVVWHIAYPLMYALMNSVIPGQ
jgi:hypothetical protein